jgi:hypothetical protein
MLLDVTGLIPVVEFLSICLWGLYDVPNLAIGIKDFHRDWQKPHTSLSTEFLPTFSIVLPLFCLGNKVNQ